MSWLETISQALNRLIISIVINLKNVSCCNSSCCDDEISIITDNVLAEISRRENVGDIDMVAIQGSPIISQPHRRHSL